MGGTGDAGMDPTIFAQDSQSEEDMIQQVRLVCNTVFARLRARCG